MVVRNHSGKQQYNQQGHNLEQEIHNSASHGGKGKNVIGNPGFTHQPAVSRNGTQHGAGAVRNKGEHHPAGTQVDREILHPVIHF